MNAETAVNGFFQKGAPFLTIEIRGVPEPVETLLDTGFNGDLLLPKDVVDRAGLPHIGDVDCMTASGDIVQIEVHVGSARWLGKDATVRVLASPGSARLLGMGMLADCRLEMEPSTETLTIRPTVHRP